MAEVVASGSQANPQAQQSPAQWSESAPHGTKRPADSSLEHEQRLSKRFDLLNLVDDNGTRLYIGIPRSNAPQPPPKPTPSPVEKPAKYHRTPRPFAADAMQVEDTPHRVYIADLNAELSDIESDEDTPIFLSDIEKHLSKIPRHVLLGPEPRTADDNQLVLYNVPTSLSVPEEQDNVRKAIVEARQRIREKQVNPATEPERASGVTGMAVGIPQGHVQEEEDEDEDAMDID